MESPPTPNLDLRSEEVQEILGTPPPWLARWGILIAFAVLIMAAYLAVYITYPRTIVVEGKVFNEEPTRNLLATNTSSIRHILIENEDTVVAGQTILVYDAVADFSDVLALDDDLHNLGLQPSDSTLLHFPYHRNLAMGELEEDYIRFFEQLDRATRLVKDPKAFVGLTDEDIARDIRRLQRDIRFERSQRFQLDEQYQNALQDYQRLVNLRAQGKANDYQIRQAESLMLNYKQLVQEKDNNIRLKEARIRDLRNQQRHDAARSTQDQDQAMQNLRLELRKLQSALEQWKNDHLLVAPVAGIVILSDKIKLGAYVEKEEKVAEIRSAKSTDLIGIAEITLKQSGLVEVGQRVVVDFYSFPAAEYGYVEGVVADLSQIPDQEDQLKVYVRFPKGLITNLGRQLVVGENMVVEMQIIVEEKRVIEWLLAGR
ncbi:MAG: HlyD family efflux transporter periplasmic adaptor subunit [Bacteroidetes bacterium]|nr:MAG: HlyD family efflux transporter periplasmic adaptor subunit [Bacteroidota bacterium]